MANNPLSKDKDRIFVGDTYPIAFATKKKDPNNNYNEVPAVPLTAEVRLYDLATDAYLQIGGPGDETANATIEGNVVKYTIAGTWHAAEADRTAFVTITFDDGQIVTVPRKYKVREKRT